MTLEVLENKFVYRDLISQAVLEKGRTRTPFRGKSMLPTLKEGMQIQIERRDPQDIRPADIILYTQKNSLLVHRVISVLRNSGKIFFITKGDNHFYADTHPIREEDLIGVVSEAFRENNPQENILINSRLVGNLYVILGKLSIFYLRHRKNVPRFIRIPLRHFTGFLYRGVHYGQMFWK
jgi:signal peptidase I